MADDTVRSTPNANVFSLALMIVRHGLQWLAGAGVISGALVTDSNAVVLTSLAVSIGTFIWGWADKRWSARATHEAVLRSLEHRMPLKMNWRSTP